MAEPALPIPASTPKSEPVPWPKPAESVPLQIQEDSPDITGGTTRRTMDDLEEKLLSGAERSVETIQRGYVEVQRAASRTLSRANRKIRYLADERPLQIVAGIAVAAFLTGAALRIWRSNHD